MKELVIQEFKANFEATGQLLDAPWPPRKRNYSWPLLNKTGKMKGNWKSEVAPKQLKIENPTEYATYHHFGTPRLPVRKLVGKSANIIEIATRHITIFLKKYL
jgi:hypothetical protein